MIARAIAAFAACAALASAGPQTAIADGGAAPRPSARAGAYVRGLWPGGPDPHAYTFEKRGHYPHYDSSYWVPRAAMRGRTRYPLRLARYGSSWGYPLSCRLQGRGECGARFPMPAGDPRNYHSRDVQRPPVATLRVLPVHATPPPSTPNTGQPSAPAPAPDSKPPSLGND